MMRRSLLALLALGLAATAPATLRAQSPAEHVTMGDRDRLTNPASALKHYEQALAAEPANYDALHRASVAAVDAGEAATDGARRAQLYKTGELYARRAMQARPNDAEGHFALARALGRTAQTLGSKDRVKYAGDVRAHALEALKFDPKHAGALHIMGVWNAEIMRLGGMSRFMAKNFLGGKIFDSASWEDAQRYMEQAVAQEPNRLVHRIDLAEIYVDRGNKEKAREQITTILRAPGGEANDAKYKRQAEELQRKL
jgi:tetratricopeptide (TPR) repeat protein